MQKIQQDDEPLQPLHVEGDGPYIKMQLGLGVYEV